MKIRAHHLLCMQLYEGKGYNDEFCKGMEQVIKDIRTNGVSFTVQKKADIICKKCPNRMKKTECRLGSQDVEKKDIEVMKALNLKNNEIISYEIIYQRLENNIDENKFLNICGSCRWFRENICSGEKWKNSFRNYNI